MIPAFAHAAGLSGAMLKGIMTWPADLTLGALVMLLGGTLVGLGVVRRARHAHPRRPTPEHAAPSAPAVVAGSTGRHAMSGAPKVGATGGRADGTALTSADPLDLAAPPERVLRVVRGPVARRGSGTGRDERESG